MNADHADSLALMARVLAGRAAVTAALMTGVDRYGFDAVVALGDGGDREAIRIGFGQRLDHPDQVRTEMTRLVAEARGRYSG